MSTAAARSRAKALHDEKTPTIVKVPGRIDDMVYNRLSGTSLKQKREDASNEELAGSARQRVKSAKRDVKVNPRITFFNTFAGEDGE